MEEYGEVGEDMPVKRIDADGALLDREIIGVEPDYPIAQELLGMILSQYSGDIRQEEDKPLPDADLLRRYRQERDSYRILLPKLRELNRLELAAEISRYREVLDKIWTNPYGESG